MPNTARYDYSGARVLVTGGTSGIGAAIAAGYRAAGADVTITGTRASVDDYADDLSGYRYHRLDVENPASVAEVAAAARESGLDILVNNAGMALPSLGLDEYQPDIFARAIEMHLTSAFRMAHGCADALAQSKLEGGASIIGIASMSSYFGIGIVPGYGAAKTGLLGLTRVLALEWAKRNIRVNAVAAGLTESRMTASTFANPEWAEPTLARTPAGRLGKPEDIAAAVLFLTSAGASWITGQTLPVDGGFTISG
ncbi:MULTISPECIES: SDR family NAD(P)-dependent oxidoreductase [Sphingomonadales]|uniref:3-oxoacyl-[acyl-carrier-protein] reductase FabG n=1 Tax=Edaphosphingomonas haloaromaticamans TaxID=653954 RepID=A0A1S1HHQ2_9SPHN|nr:MULTISPECIES: SDR family oxidoreductase [Sphingomonas]MDX3883456.1 SDR family oxidoreductase [Sphingomonas sp.]OHT20743.1 3-oxoacyl-[acyl-carrier-protein] reductase FabG [Sphingomonas haloaromaticamans]